MKDRFVKIITNGGDADDLYAFKSENKMQPEINTEKISAKLLFEITRNTGFETNKKQIGPCFVTDCCEWIERQKDDICGLDDSRINTAEKMKMLLNHSVLKSVLEEAGI